MPNHDDVGIQSNPPFEHNPEFLKAMKEWLSNRRRRRVKMKLCKITLLIDGEPQGHYIDHPSGTVLDLTDNLEPGSGETYLLESVEMTEEEYEKLPEFTGF